ncbi:MAG: efflux RND transporter periplasmic adaptor subunit [Bacteroidetes bacterium]|nr:efflux RND transporter periplasmic adaptor subunit [Bacteroidota bacterium]
METKNADLSSLRIDRSNKTVNPDRNKGLINTIITVIVLVVVGFAIYYGYTKLFTADIEVSLTSVTLQTPAQSNAVLTASGYVVAQRKAAVASKATGRLVQLGVVEGDAVFKNQIIARIEDSDIKAQLEQAKANQKLSEADLKESERNYNRQLELLKSGFTSQMDVDAAETRYQKVLASIDVAKAMVLGAEVALENTLIRAPFNGTVLTKNADVGEVVAPLGAGVNSRGAVVTMADMTSLQVEADVSESNIEKIKPDQGCQITLDAYPSYNYAGYVAKIVPTADRSKATVMVKVGFKNYDTRVLPEMSAKVLFLNDIEKDVVLTQEQYLVLPKNAIRKEGGNSFVFVVRNDLATEMPVSIGRDLGDYYEITGGLNNGDRVINNLTDEIKNEVKVKIK